MRIKINELNRIVGENNISDDLTDLYVNSSDASVHQPLQRGFLKTKKL